tara:strand:- start:1746 stop:1934 length:189 start_codon:yes stop_codon:yes gene_type:complete
MKVGDLVRISDTVNFNRRPKQVGLVLEIHPEDGYLHETVLVKWPDAEEIEFPHLLEIVNASR